VIIGVTGSRYGMTPQQEKKFRSLIYREVGYRNLDRSASEKDQFHHGACVGADEQMARIAKEEYGLWLVAHPGDMPSWTTKYDSDVTLKPQAALMRNMDIVYQCDVLIAMPHTHHEVLRSGTWATIRGARSRSVRGVIVYPDGLLEEL